MFICYVVTCIYISTIVKLGHELLCPKYSSSTSCGARKLVSTNRAQLEVPENLFSWFGHQLSCPQTYLYDLDTKCCAPNMAWAQTVLSENSSLLLGHGLGCSEICLHDSGTDCGTHKLIFTSRASSAVPRIWLEHKYIVNCSVRELVSTTRARIAVPRNLSVRLGLELLGLNYSSGTSCGPRKLVLI